MSAVKHRNKRADKFRDDAIAFVRARDGKGVTLSRYDNETEWLHWQDYFRHIGLKGSVSMMETDREWIVPCSSPIEFDPDVALDAIAVGDRMRENRRIAKMGVDTIEKRIAIIAKAKAMYVAQAKPTPEELKETFDERMARLSKSFREAADKGEFRASVERLKDKP